MPNEDEYVELCENARDALRHVLTATEPGTGLLLHRAYNTLCDMIERDRATPPPSPSSVALEQARETATREARAWRAFTLHDRERLVLEVIGDERLTISEVVKRVNAAGVPDLRVYTSQMRSVMTRMLDRGQLDRERETFRNKPRFRYFRNAALRGPIADLERTFRESGEGETA